MLQEAAREVRVRRPDASAVPALLSLPHSLHLRCALRGRCMNDCPRCGSLLPDYPAAPVPPMQYTLVRQCGTCGLVRSRWVTERPDGAPVVVTRDDPKRT